MIATRKRLNSLNKSIESLRDTRKQILSSNISADAKRARIVQLDKQTNNVARNITKLRLASDYSTLQHLTPMHPSLIEGYTFTFTFARLAPDSIA
jgi:hypothetical protein